ncbi:MAG: dicarboxylate/amino acid:cation symporter [Acidobacteriota bacterium]
MTSAVRMILGLVAGLALGVWISLTDAPWMKMFASAVEPVGTIFINAIRMTVIPLIVSKLIVGIASASDDRTVRRIGGAGLLLFVCTVFVASGFSVLAGVPAMGRIAVDANVAASLRQAASSQESAAAASQLPSLSQWLVDLVPANAIRAAAEGLMLPLIIFSLALGFALTRVEPSRRHAILPVFHAIADAMLTLVRWILVTAPVGVFALALPLAARMGLAAAGALVYYIALVALGCLIFAVVVIYPAAALGGGLSLAAFARAAAPAQAIAFSSRSSMASLPVMMEAARNRLGLREDVTGFLLPLAAAMFRAGSAVGLTMGAVFLAQLYGVPLGPAAMLSIVLTVVVTSLGSPGIPSGSILVIVPILMAGGIPVEGAGILLGVDTLPDMFRTTTNITGDMAAAAVIGRRIKSGAPAQTTRDENKR